MKNKIDYLLTVAEEIEMTLGLKHEVVNEKVFVDTIAGKIEVKALFNELMQDVYRFIYVYGTKLHKYGLSQRIKCTTPSVSGRFIFNKDLIEKLMTADKPCYAMGVDTHDKGNLAYCLTRKIDGVIEVLLSKTMRDETEFKQEVETLSNCFDADVFKSGD